MILLRCERSTCLTKRRPAPMPIEYAELDQSAKDGVQGWSLTRSSLEQMNQIMKLIDEDLREGAIGIGSPTAYFQRGVTSYEQFEAQRTAARYGRLASVHTRFHMGTQTPTEAPIGTDEVLANAMLLRASDVPAARRGSCPRDHVANGRTSACAPRRRRCSAR